MQDFRERAVYILVDTKIYTAMKSISHISSKSPFYKICPTPGKEIADLIIENPVFASDFFFPERPEDIPSIGPLRSNLIKQYYCSYNIRLNPKDVSTAIFEHLWSDGTWSNLKSYDGSSSIFTWLSTVSFRCVMSYLKANGMIDIPSSSSMKNVKLDLEKFDEGYCYTLITEVMHLPLLKDILLAKYVDKLGDKAIMKKFSLSKELYKDSIETAEQTLITLIMEKHTVFQEVLSTKQSRTRVSEKLLSYLPATEDETPDPHPIIKKMGLDIEDPYLELKIKQYLRDFSQQKMKWRSETDRYIWEARVLDEIDSEEVAETVGHKADWLYVKLHRLKQKYQKEFLKFLYDKDAGSEKTTRQKKIKKKGIK